MLRISLALTLLTPAALAQNRTDVVEGTRMPRSTGLASPSAGIQELFVCTSLGRIFRVDNYATSPTAVLLGDPGLGSLGDIAFDPTQGDFVVLQFGSDIYRVDPVTMASTLVGTPGATYLNALEIDDAGNYYSRAPSDTHLYSIEPATGATTPIGDTGHDSSGDLAMRPGGMLLGTTGTELVDEIDPTDGSATVIGPHHTGELAYGIEVDVDGTVYLITATRNIYTYDPASSTATYVATIGGIGALDEVWGCTFRLNPAGGCTTSTYCNPGDGSTNNTATIGVTGCDLSGTILLHMADGPPNQFAYALIGNGSTIISQPPGSVGDLCVAGGGCLGRYAKDISTISGAGTLSLDLSNSASGGPNYGIPVCGGTIQSGDTWNFQFWHRNPMGAPSSFSEAISVTFL